MDFKIAKRKKFAPHSDLFPLPVKANRSFLGVFNGYNVTISSFDEMIDVYFMGNFGKGSLSKSAPNYHTLKDDMPKLVFEQQWENQSKWKESDNMSSSKNSEKFLSFHKYQNKKAKISLNRLLVSAFNEADTKTWDNLSDYDEFHNLDNNTQNLPHWMYASDDSASDSSADLTADPVIELTENILKNKKMLEIHSEKNTSNDIIVVDADGPSLNDIKARLDKDNSLIKETLSLSLEEAFFLSFALGCLIVQDLSNAQLSINDMWQKFSTAQDDFIINFVAYHYYRSNGWTVKSGLKYGGNYLLYKKGPAHYHATYLVQVVDGRKKLSWNELIGANRLVETFNKDLLLCYVIRPEDLTEDDLSNPEILTKFSVDECLMRRWLPSQERNVKK